MNIEYSNSINGFVFLLFIIILIENLDFIWICTAYLYRFHTTTIMFIILNIIGIQLILYNINFNIDINFTIDYN